ncbi:MAG: AAA+ family ATPase [Pseudomonadota bacterium]
MTKSLLIAVLLGSAALTAGPAAADGHAEEEGFGDFGPLLPDDEELRALGDMAQRWMREFADRMDPFAERLRELVDDLDAYEAPERLPNGDIIIRRKPDAPEPPVVGEGPGVDL